MQPPNNLKKHKPGARRVQVDRRPQLVVLGGALGLRPEDADREGYQDEEDDGAADGDGDRGGLEPDVRVVVAVLLLPDVRLEGLRFGVCREAV